MSDETYHWPEASVWSVLLSTHELTAEQLALLAATSHLTEASAAAA